MSASTQSGGSSLAFWEGHLAGIEPGLSLPKGRQFLETVAVRPGFCDLPLDNRLSQELEALALSGGLPSSALWLGAFFGLLFRYTSQQDLLIVQATPVRAAGRPWAGEGQIPAPGIPGGSGGVCPVRLRVCKDLSVLDLSHAVKEALERCESFGTLALPEVHQLLGSGAEGTPASLVQFAFVSTEDQIEADALLPAAGEMESLPSELSLTVYRNSTSVWLRFLFNERRYSKPGVEWMAKHYAQVLASVERNPGGALGELFLATEQEQALLEEWSRGPTPAGNGILFPERFELHVAHKPDALAVVHDGGRWTFRELDERANQLAHHLQSLGVGPDILVGVGMEPSPEMVMAAVAILKAGGALLFFDVATPGERLAALEELAAPAIVLTKARHHEKWRFARATRVMLDEATPLLSRLPRTAPVNRATPRNAGFVFFTSGSTGHPKIVVQPYGLCSAELSDDTGERHLLKSSSGTSFTTAEVMAVMRGKTLFIVPERVEHDLQRLVSFIGQHGISDVLLVPSALRAMLMLDDLGSCGCLQTVDCIGETVFPDLKRLFFERIRADFVVSYGCTEARSATTGLIRPDDDPGYNCVGRTNPGMEVYVLDAERRLTPIEIPGEVYVGGRIAAGYLNDPARTAGRFVPHPFDPTPGARLFRTGDSGRWLASGRLEILGRLDHQVKIRGFRIEPGEVEAALCQHPGIKQAAVAALDGPSETKVLVAYITTNAPWSELGNLRRELRRKLPEPMVPARFVLLEKMPQTANGKCDRKALAGSAGRELGPGPAFVAPRNPTENTLAGIWAAVLGRDAVGVHDDFFDLGGDSLAAVRLVAEVKKVYGQAPPVAALLGSPTVEAMTQCLLTTPGAHRWTSLVPMKPVGSQPPFYFVHGWGGGVLGFVKLAQCLGNDQPCYGLQAAGFEEKQVVHFQVEDMAAHYAREIRSLQPQGPYYLGGYSAGGWIAFATAQELRRQGQQVGMLAMIDTFTSPLLPWALYVRVRGPHLMGRLRFHLRHWFSMPLHERGKYVAGRWTALKNHWAHNRKPPSKAASGVPTYAARLGNDPGPSAQALHRFMCKQMRTDAAGDDLDPYIRAVLSYKPDFYDSPVDFFLAVDNHVARLVSVLCFFRGDVRIHRVHGTHLEILDKNHIHSFSKTFTEALHAARQRHDGESHTS